VTVLFYRTSFSECKDYTSVLFYVLFRMYRLYKCALLDLLPFDLWTWQELWQGHLLCRIGVNKFYLWSHHGHQSLYQSTLFSSGKSRSHNSILRIYLGYDILTFYSNLSLSSATEQVKLVESIFKLHHMMIRHLCFISASINL
jgi:hypothetical protein